jgi:autophagy-related protein 2
LLQLPPNLRLLTARLLSLRLTIPANFFQQSIIAEVEGIHLHVLADAPTAAESHDHVDDKGTPEHRKTNRRIHSPSASAHDPGALLSTQRLARSILQDEPIEEKQHLEARYMANSSTTDASHDLGTGTSLGLPAMVATFLQGIIDRVQIRIKDVNFSLSVHNLVPETSPVIFVAHIATINVEAAVAHSDLKSPAGKRRRIALQALGLHLLREDQFTPTPTSVAHLFASYAPELSPTKEDQTATVSPTKESPLQDSRILPSHTHSFDSDPESLPDEMTQSTASFGIRPGEDNLSWASRRSQSLSDHDQLWSSFAPEDDQSASDMLQNMSSSVFLSTIDTRGTHSAHFQSPIGQSFISAQASQSALSSPFIHQDRHFHSYHHGEQDVVENSSSKTSPTPSLHELDQLPAMAESVVYSHAEAESMYMSAVGQEPTSPKLRSIPGGWNSELDDDQDPDPPFLSKYLAQGSSYDSEDGAPTPRLPNQSSASEHPPIGPQDAKLSYCSKEILTMHDLTIGILETQSTGNPTHDPEDVTSQSSMTASAFHQAPGAFSVYAEGGRSSLRFNAPSRSDEAPELTDVDETMDTTIEINASPINLHFDAGTVRSIITLMEVVKTQAPLPKRESVNVGPVANQKLPRVSLQLESLGISLFDDLPEKTSTEPTDLSVWRPGPSLTLEKRALLQLVLKDIEVQAKDSSQSKEATLQIGDFTFTAGTNDMLSFDRSPSPKSDHSAIHRAISVTTRTRTSLLGQSVREINARILPVFVNLDLMKFDDDFDALGGLTGIVEMSSSLLSSGVFSSKVEVQLPPRRGVRFQESVPSENALVQTKFSARLESFNARLTSKSCCLALQASTTKILSREKYLALVIDKAFLDMPTPRAAAGHSNFDVAVGGIKLIYSFSPEEQDLGRLISLVTPSKNQYENDDDIMIHTLLRQRRKGSVLNVQVAKIQTRVHDWTFVPHLQSLGDELSKLSAVTKYLPEDDTPGVLSLIRIDDTTLQIPINNEFGLMEISLNNIQVVHVGLPALYAISVGSMKVGPVGGHYMVHEVLPGACTEDLPMLMARMVGDEVEPIVKMKLFNICVEYDVATLLSLTSTKTASEVEQKVQDLTASILESSALQIKELSTSAADPSKASGSIGKKLALDVLLHDCALGLQPKDLESKGLILLKNSKFGTAVPSAESVEAKLDIRQATVYVVDGKNTAAHNTQDTPGLASQPNHAFCLQTYLLDEGYVAVSSIRSAQAIVSVVADHSTSENFIDVELRDEFFLLETCADSTQTLIAVLNGLSPPAVANNDLKFRTQPDSGLMTLDDMVSSFSGEAFIKPGPGPSTLFDADEDSPLNDEEDLMAGSDMPSDLYEPIEGAVGSEDEDFPTRGTFPSDTVESLLEQDPFEMTSSPQLGDDALLRSLRKELGSLGATQPSVIRPFHQDDRQLDKIYGGSRALGEAQEQHKRYPIQVRVRDVNIIWNLYDGYDWRRTREAITQAVEEVEMKLEERKSSRRRSNTLEDETETVIGDCLFNSIYIGIPSAREPADLRHSISHMINQGNEAASETESYATTGISKPSQADLVRQRKLRKKRLRLQRGESHKLGFELKGVCVDFLVHPPGSGEIQSSVDVRVTDFEIFDHVPTSTWKKFLTFHTDKKNMREMMKPMIHLELLNVRPVPELETSEMTICVSR